MCNLASKWECTSCYHGIKIRRILLHMYFYVTSGIFQKWLALETLSNIILDNIVLLRLLHILYAGRVIQILLPCQQRYWQSLNKQKLCEWIISNKMVLKKQCSTGCPEYVRHSVIIILSINSIYSMKIWKTIHILFIFVAIAAIVVAIATVGVPSFGTQSSICGLEL